MATVPWVDLISPPGYRGKYTVISWQLTNGDDGQFLEVVDWADRCISVEGAFGAGGTCIIEGRNTPGGQWFTLTDQQGNQLSFTQAGLKHIFEFCRQIRPRVTAGDASTALTIAINEKLLG